MALEFYVEQADRSPRSGIANETIKPGELVIDSGSGVDLATFSASDVEVQLARYDAQAFAREHDDEVRAAEYDPNDDMRKRVQYQPQEDGAVVRIRSPEDNGTDPAPTFSHRDVVGILDETAVGGTAAEFTGRVVPEGYADSTPTTFDRGSGNFKAVGVAYRPGRQTGDDISEFDYPVRVALFGELKE